MQHQTDVRLMIKISIESEQSATAAKWRVVVSAQVAACCLIVPSSLCDSVCVCCRVYPSKLLTAYVYVMERSLISLQQCVCVCCAHQSIKKKKKKKEEGRDNRVIYSRLMNFAVAASPSPAAPAPANWWGGNQNKISSNTFPSHLSLTSRLPLSFSFS